MPEKYKVTPSVTGNYENKIGFQLGGVLNAQINKYFVIRPELVFNNIGGKYRQGNQTLIFNTNYISLPINFIGQIPLNDNFKLQGFIGSYAALGVGGKIKYDLNGGKGNDKINMKKDPDTSYNDVYQNPWDFGVNFGLGFQAKSLVFSASYSIGLSNTAPHHSNAQKESDRGKNYTTSNKYLSVGVAYLFGGK